MALVEYGGGVASFRGSIGGLTFQRNGAGSIVRTRPIQKKQVTPIQSAENNILTGLIHDWQALPLLTQSAWNTFSDAHDKVNMWGDSRVINGFNWFFMLNRNAITMGKVALTSPPAYTVPDALPVYALNIDCNKIELVWQSGFTTINTGMLVYCTNAIRNAKTPFRRSMKFIKYLDSVTPVDYDITTEWEAAFNVSYPPGSGCVDIKIQAFLVPVQKVTYIDTAGYYTASHLQECDLAIPDMEISCNFIVR